MISSKVTLREKVGYGFGDAASSMFWKIFTMYLAIFYTDIFGIPAAAVGTMLLVTRIWDTVTDPIMGIIADRTHSRWGKFRPYLLWGAIPFAIIGVLLFVTPDFSSTGNLVYAYITYGLMMTAYTVVNVPYASLLGVMSADGGERTTLASYRMVFAFGGSLLVVAMYQPLVSKFSEIFPVTTAYTLTVAVIAAIAALMFFLTFSWTRERIKPPKNQQNNLKEDIKNLFKNKPWFILLGAGVATLIFNSVRDGVAVYYFKYFISDGANEDSVGLFSGLTLAYSTFYLLLGQATNMLGVIMANPVSALIGKRKTFIYAMFGAAIMSFFFNLAGKDNLVLIYLLQALISFCAGIIFPLLWSMYADSGDFSEWKTGRQSTGLIFSASSMTQKLGGALGGSITLWLLAIYGFMPNVAQSAHTLSGIKYMMGIVPGAAALISGLFMVFYPLSDKKMTTISSELAKRRAAEPE